jgi:hypothetical protein
MTRSVAMLACLALRSGAAVPLEGQGRKLYFGVAAGINFAKWTGDDVGSGAERRTAFHGGGTVGLDLSQAFSLQSGLSYSQEGTGADLGGGVSGAIKATPTSRTPSSPSPPVSVSDLPLLLTA